MGLEINPPYSAMFFLIGSNDNLNFDDDNPDVNDDDDDGHGWCCKEGAADWRVALAGMVASPPGG